MDFRFSEREEAFRREVDDFIKKELPANWAEENLYWPGGYGAVPEFEEINPVTMVQGAPTSNKLSSKNVSVTIGHPWLI